MPTGVEGLAGRGGCSVYLVSRRNGNTAEKLCPRHRCPCVPRVHTQGSKTCEPATASLHCIAKKEGHGIRSGPTNRPKPLPPMKGAGGSWGSSHHVQHRVQLCTGLPWDICTGYTRNNYLCIVRRLGTLLAHLLLKPISCTWTNHDLGSTKKNAKHNSSKGPPCPSPMTLGAFSHSAGTGPIITLFIPGTPLKATHLQKRA